MRKKKLIAQKLITKTKSLLSHTHFFLLKHYFYTALHININWHFMYIHCIVRRIARAKKGAWLM